MWFLRIFHIVSKLPVKRVLAFSQKRQSNGLFSAFKIVLSCAVGLTLSMVMFTLLFSNDDNIGYTRSVKETKQHFLGLKFVKPKPKVKKFKNHKGKINGLNLLLIDNIENECYVKEYLTIAKKSQDGTLFKEEMAYKATVEKILGVAMTEQGTYPQSNGMLPLSGLPWDSSAKGPRWNKEQGITLTDVNSSVYNSGKVSIQHNAGYTGEYVGPFQAKQAYFHNGAFKATSLNGTGTSDGRAIDALYFPDQVGGISYEYSNKISMLKSGTDFGSLTPDAVEMMVSILYSGSPQLRNDYVPGSGAEKSKNINTLSAFADKLTEEYGRKIYDKLGESEKIKWAMVVPFIKEGGKISSETRAKFNISYQKGAAKLAMETFGINGSVEEFLNSAVDSSLPYQGNETGIMSITLDGVKFMVVPESFFHYIGEKMAGGVEYARMLKFAGVDVDPTNPATYMTMVGAEEEDEDGEGDTWTPDGEEIKWMIDAGVDVSKLSPDRVKALNYAHQYIGLPYKWGGTNPNTDGGLDCSGFVQWTMKNAMGKSNFGRNTIAQEQEGHEIPWSEARPGDLLFFGSHGSTHHVAFYLSGTNKSDVVYMDEPRTDKTCQVAKGATWESGSVWVLRLDNVYDDSVHYASNVDDNSGIQGGDLGAVGSTKNIDGKEFEVLPRNLIVPIPKSSYPSPMFSQQFGVPQSWNGKYHAGDDIPVHDGTPVYAADDGVVIKSVDLEESYGHHIIIRDDNSHTHTVYGHLTTRLVQKGDRVKRGQKIGISGHTGNVRPKGPDGAHLHFEVRDMDNWGVPVDPFKDPGKRLTFGDMNYVDRSNGKLYKEKSTGLW